MPRRLRPPKSLSVTSKFVITYVSILTVSMAIVGYILYVQATASAVAQAQVVMEQHIQQIKSNVAQRVSLIQNLSQIVAFDPRIQNFLGSAFLNESFELQDYRDNIAPILDNLMLQNTYVHSIRVYMRNDSIPELFDRFYHMERIRGKWQYYDFIQSKSMISRWQDVHLEGAVVQLPGSDHSNQVFSLDRKIFSAKYTDMAGMLEIEVNRDVLFDMLKNDKDNAFGSIVVIDQGGQIVSNNIRGSFGHNIAALGLPPIPANRLWNAVTDVKGTPSIVISTPLDGPDITIVGVFPVDQFNAKVKSSQKWIVLILLASLLLLSVIVFLITNALLSRMRVLVSAMKRVREGSLDVSVPVLAGDEFSLMAQSFNHMTGRIHELVETVYKSKLQEKEAELRVLESQINPHFLYNTLATISWVARKVKSPEITQLSNSLAKFYRLVLSKGQSVILIRDEIEMVRVYVHIQKFRFEELFDVLFQIDEQVLRHFTAKNIVQPLVENALNHGIAPKRSHGTIILKAGTSGDMLYFQVIDDGVGIAADKVKQILRGQIEKSSGSGYAVKNIMERLTAYYGDRHRFEIFSRPGIGTAVTITFPRE